MRAKYYDVFPTLKAQCGLVLDFGPKHVENRYCWYPDTAMYREHIIRTKGEAAQKIYVGWLRKWLATSKFISYASDPVYEKDKIERLEKGYK